MTSSEPVRSPNGQCVGNTSSGSGGRTRGLPPERRRHR